MRELQKKSKGHLQEEMLNIKIHIAETKTPIEVLGDESTFYRDLDLYAILKHERIAKEIKRTFPLQEEMLNVKIHNLDKVNKGASRSLGG